MLFPRIIPCLLIKDHGLVKTAKFRDPKYVGDPINAVRIFNEKEVDEIIVLDIDATRLKREPDFKLIEQLASECRMPLCYGGGVTTSDQIQRIIQLGVEKVAISTAAIENPGLVSEAAKFVGNQSIVVVLDIKASPGNQNYEVWTHSGLRGTGRSPTEVAVQLESLGAGEIVINSIDKDGLMKGYDLDLVAKVREAVNVPLTVLGGAGSLKDIGKLISKYGVIGAAAGSLFVFKGIYRAVLINYPNRAEKDLLIKENYYISQFAHSES
jgi:cyclase